MTAVPKIPIQNIYYLLCYAWNKLDERDIVNVESIDSKNILELFAKVLIGGLTHLFKRGLDRGYVDSKEDTRCLKGKICFAPTLKRNLLMKAQVQCEFDEVSHNVLHNQIIKSTLHSLIHVKSIDAGLKNDLIGLYRKLREIGVIHLSYSCFSRVQLNSNNYFYDFLMKTCELIYDNLLIAKDSGESKFRDFLQDEKRMAFLFEEFIRNFYRIEAEDCKVAREDIFWDAIPLDELSAAYLPKMTTDISIERNGSKAVIETKYYKETLLSNFDQEKYHSGHLYQLFSYLKNLEAKGGVNKSCSGILLYPTVDYDLKGEGVIMGGHKVMVRTINLNQNWKMIHTDLINLLEDSLQNQ